MTSKATQKKKAGADDNIAIFDMGVDSTKKKKPSNKNKKSKI